MQHKRFWAKMYFFRIFKYVFSATEKKPVPENFTSNYCLGFSVEIGIQADIAAKLCRNKRTNVKMAAYSIKFPVL